MHPERRESGDPDSAVAMRLRPDPKDSIGVSGVSLGKAKIEVEYDPSYGKWEAREKPTIWNLWLGSFLCFGDTREHAIENATEILRQKKLKETVKVEL